MRKNIALLVVLTGLLLCGYKSSGQKTNWAMPPKAILVQLKCEENRRHHFEANGNSILLSQVLKDAEAVRKVTVNDFRDHFSFCKVYFFMDSNFYPVIQQKLHGYLLHADGTKASGEEISALDSNYLIVNYNTPYKIEERGEWARDSVAITNDRSGLVVYDRHYRQMEYPFHYFIRANVSFLVSLNIIKPNEVYNYGSRRFDMSYYEIAEKFQESLIRSYGRW